MRHGIGDPKNSQGLFRCRMSFHTTHQVMIGGVQLCRLASGVPSCLYQLKYPGTICRLPGPLFCGSLWGPRARKNDSGHWRGSLSDWLTGVEQRTGNHPDNEVDAAHLECTTTTPERQLALKKIFGA